MTTCFTTQQTVYNTSFPKVVGCPDLSTLKALTLELYKTRAPLLKVSVLDKVKSDKDDFYGDTATPDRAHDPFHVHIFGPLDPYEFEAGFFGVDPKRPLTLFSVCAPELEALSLALKPGDLIDYDGMDHEILTIKRLEDAYFAHTNYCLEFVLATDLPEIGS